MLRIISILSSNSTLMNSRTMLSNFSKCKSTNHRFLHQRQVVNGCKRRTGTCLIILTKIRETSITNNQTNILWLLSENKKRNLHLGTQEETETLLFKIKSLDMQRQITLRVLLQSWCQINTSWLITMTLSRPQFRLWNLTSLIKAEFILFKLIIFIVSVLGKVCWVFKHRAIPSVQAVRGHTSLL